MKRIARRAARTDSNHAEIVKVLRQCGMAVQDLSACGGGVPDLLVGWRGFNMLLEIKRPNAPPSKQLTQAQENWHATWPGALAVVESAREAVEAVCGAVAARGAGAEGKEKEEYDWVRAQEAQTAKWLRMCGGDAEAKGSA